MKLRVFGSRNALRQLSSVMFSQRSPRNARDAFSAYGSQEGSAYNKGPSRENAMANTSVVSMVATLSLILTTNLVSAEQFGTAEEARAMLDRAIAALKSDETTALRAISDTKNKQFHDRDLHVSCFNMSDGKFTAFPSPGMIGIDVRSFKLGDDPIGQRAFDAIQNAPEGTVATMDYNFPKSGKPALKQSLETRIGDQGCGVAYYK